MTALKNNIHIAFMAAMFNRYVCRTTVMTQYLVNYEHLLSVS